MSSGHILTESYLRAIPVRNIVLPLREVLSRLLLVSVVLSLLSGCGILGDSGGEGDGERTVRPSRCSSSQVDSGAMETSGEPEDFEKPEAAAPGRDPRDTLDSRPSETLPYRSDGRGVEEKSWGIRPRAYLAPNKSKTEIWVDDEKDEPAVIDFSIWWDSTAYRPGDAHELDLLVFIDFRRVPFRLTRVDGEPNSEPFPTRQEASTGGGLEKSADLVVPKDIPNAYTLSLPPESLGERGAHDLRIVAFGPPRDENPDWASRRFSFGWKLTVNNGGTAFVARSQIPGSNVPTEIPPKRMLGPLAIVGTALMAPGMTAEEYWEANYANVFEIASDTARLDSWQSGRPGVENFPIAFVTLDGNRVVDGSRWLDQFPAQPEIRDNENLGRIRVPDTPFARNYDVDVPIGDEKVHTIRQIAFAKPFCRHVEPGNFRVTNSVKVRKK